jgi:DNA-binding Lrp family transcriptional regulator
MARTFRTRGFPWSAPTSVDGVTGPYDVIARGEAVDLDELAKSIVMPIQAVEGVTRTLTCPVLQL